MRNILLSLIVTVFFFSAVSAENMKVFYSDGPKNSKKVALTFDDGPGFSTNKILDILNEKEVKATFFILGSQAVKNPIDAKRIADEGHEIASHTYGHFNFYSYKGENKQAKIESELIKAEETIEKITGKRTSLVRYPHGYSRPDAIAAAKKHGYFVVNWSFGCDWQQNLSAEEMHAKYLGAIKNGAILLMHDSIKSGKLASFLGVFIDEIREKGYDIVTVSELLGLEYRKQPKEIILEEP